MRAQREGVWVKHDGQQQNDSFAQQRETWRRAYAEARTVRERFPRIECLTVDMVFCDSKRIGTYSPQMRILGASARAFFWFACPRTLCLHGGFDLDSIIQGSFKTERVDATGILRCEGWLHPVHSENSRCGLELHYSVCLSYEVLKPTEPKRRARD